MKNLKARHVIAYLVSVPFYVPIIVMLLCVALHKACEEIAEFGTELSRDIYHGTVFEKDEEPKA